MSEIPYPNLIPPLPARPAPADPQEPVRENLDENGLPPEGKPHPGFQHGKAPTTVPPARQPLPKPPSAWPGRLMRQTVPSPPPGSIVPAEQRSSAGLAVPEEKFSPGEISEAPLSRLLFEEMLDQAAEIPGNLAILGVGSDDLPLILDLDDPQPGSLAVASNDPDLRQRFLRSLLLTASELNAARTFQFFVLSSQPRTWQSWVDQHALQTRCLGVEGLPAVDESEPEKTARWLIKLAALAEKRCSGAFPGPALLIVADDLRAATRLPYEARVSFDRLVREGARARMRVLAALDLSEADELARWVRLFRTRICGSANGALAAPALFADAHLRLKAGQFAVRVGENWLRFNVPQRPDELA